VCKAHGSASTINHPKTARLEMQSLGRVVYDFSAEVAVESAEFDAHDISFSPNLKINPEASIGRRIPLPSRIDKGASGAVAGWNRLI
jgi:hypothetical protein